MGDIFGDISHALGTDGSGSGGMLTTIAAGALIVATGGAAAAAVGGWATTGLSVALADTAISGAALVSAGYAIGTVAEIFVISEGLKAITGDPSASVNEALATGLLLNTSSNVAGIPVIYGSRRVGGTRVFVGVSGANNEYLHLVVVLAEGPVFSIDNVYIDGVLTTDSKFSGLVTSYLYNGTTSQTYDTHLAADLPSQWGAGYDGKGVAYVYLKLKYSSSAFTGLPIITADVRGIATYDPRTGKSPFSSNPALCIRDYLTNTRYGRGISASLIDDTSIAAAANYCDATVTIPGGSQARYTCDGVIDVNQTAYDNIKSLLTSCRGMLVYSGGMYKLVLDQNASAGFAFSEDN
ncbi:MAG: hypothetical protein HXX19_18210, partial [Rhodoferax sp.]|nr:hypothetical protein [Rhodoferax sp.]